MKAPLRQVTLGSLLPENTQNNYLRSRIGKIMTAYKTENQMNRLRYCSKDYEGARTVSTYVSKLGKPPFQKSAVFFNIVQTGGGQPMFKNYVGNCRVFWRSFNNMKFAWKGTFEALMVKFGGKIGTLYQIFTPCTPLPKYKRAFTWFLGGSNSLPGCRRIFYRGLP